MAKLEITEEPVNPIKLNKKDPNAAVKAVREAVKAAPKKNPGKAKTTSKTPKVQHKGKKNEAHVTRPTADEQIVIQERRAIVWRLRKRRMSFRDIVDELKKTHRIEVSVGTVHKDVAEMLDEMANELALDVFQHVEAECATLDDLQAIYFPLAENPDFNKLGEYATDAANVVITCVKERSRLRNLYKIPDVPLTPSSELAKLLGIHPDQLPKKDGE